MKIFATRTYGFYPEKYPVLGFGLEGNRDKLLQQSQPGDLILIVGTQTDPTKESDKGRLLGIAEFGRQAVDTLAIIDPSLVNKEDLDSDGHYRWPKALAYIRAWRFPSKPLLKDVLSKQLPYNANTQAILLSEEDALAISRIECVEVIIQKSDEMDILRIKDTALNRNKPTTGPIPSEYSKEVTRTLGKEAFTYALQYGDSDCWKIGETANIKGG